MMPPAAWSRRRAGEKSGPAGNSTQTHASTSDRLSRFLICSTTHVSTFVTFVCVKMVREKKQRVARCDSSRKRERKD